MSKPQIRSSQIITTFGPGSLVDLPDAAVIIAGIDSWTYHQGQPIPAISEPRLEAKIAQLLGRERVELREPPAAIEIKGFTPDITAFLFPEWFVVQHAEIRRGWRSRRLVHVRDLEQGSKYRDRDGKRYPVVPIRFVRACRRGHIGDIDWYSFVHGEDEGCRRELYLEERGTSGDLDTIWVRCSCGAERSLSQAARMELRALGSCNGSRPWLGPGTREGCGEPNRLLIRSASNAYFSQRLSVISIPDSFEAIDEVVDSFWDAYLSEVETAEELATISRIKVVREPLAEYEPERILEAIHRRRESASRVDRPIKSVEFEALARADHELVGDSPGGLFFARTLDEAQWQAPWMKGVERVVLVHRLREVVAQLGFTRFEAAAPDIMGELDMAVERAPIALDVPWLPAMENRGEGFFLQLRPSSIEEWLARPSVADRGRELGLGFDLWKSEHEGSGREFPGLPYIMIHSLSHMLMTSIALECGYPASSLRERIYAIPGAPGQSGQYGILIYTGTADAEGTLGGLVEEARRIKFHMKRALESGALCSNDPVCAFHRPQRHDHQPLLGSACHGCLLVSETSCEQHNDFLDRALVVETVEHLGASFFGDAGV